MAKDLSVSVMMDYYGTLLTDNQLKMMQYYYNDDLSLSEIAEIEGITRQGVRDTLKRAEQFMKTTEEKLHYMAKMTELSVKIDNIRQACIEISEYNLRYGSSREINERAKAIYEMAGELV